MAQLQKEHIGWIDFLRVAACFMMVLSHCCDPFVALFDNDSPVFLTGAFTGSLMRPCVPLFAMMSGVLLFPMQTSMGAFYRKRIGRILVPLIFWSIALPLLFFAYLNHTATASPLISMDNYTVGSLWTKLSTFFFNFNYDTTPLWYLYMLIGLYLVIPIVDAWLRQASKRDIRLFLWAWGISLLLPYIKMAGPLFGYDGNYGNTGILGVCDWNSYGTFYYVSGFFGYLVLARYLMLNPLAWSGRKAFSICIPTFLIGYAITALGFVLTQQYYPGSYANLEIVWYFTGINVFMMTFPIFVLAQRLKITAPPMLKRLAAASFGIYLCHFVFVQVAYDLFGALSVPAIVRILMMAVTAFFVSYALVWLLSTNRWTRKLVQ